MPAPEDAPEDSHVVVGKIIGAHGIRGEVKLQSFTAEPGDIAGYDGLLIGDSGRKTRVTALKSGNKGFMIARLCGVEDRNAAEALKGCILKLRRGDLPETESGEFYFLELIGLQALRQDGSVFGEVVAVHNYGAGDLLEVRPVDGRATVLLPFTEACVPEIDLAAGKLIIDPPEGLLEK